MKGCNSFLFLKKAVAADKLFYRLFFYLGFCSDFYSFWFWRAIFGPAAMM